MATTDPTTHGVGGAPADDLVLAREPILDRDGEVLGFELLYRPIGSDGRPTDPSSATATVLSAALGEIGLDALVGSSLAFVNVTRDFLLDLRPLPLPPDRFVLELLEDQPVDDALLAVLHELVAAGFTLALDDFVHRPELEPAIDLARFVKLDVNALAPDALAEQVALLRGRGVELVAEKVETRAQFEACLELGFDAFQGYFFAQPDLIRRERTPTFRLDTLSALIGTDDDAFEALEQLISCDVGLSHKLLRLANSAHVGARTRVSSIRQALTLLGARTVRRWVTMLVLADGRSEFDELLLTALIRARMCELIAGRDAHADPDRAFTAGLFSVADALLHEPLPELVQALPFDDRLVAALLEHEGPEGRILDAALAYERGFFDVAAELDRDLKRLARSYYAALEWAYGVTLAMR